MEQYNGKYRFVSAENKAAVVSCWFNNKMPEKDLELIMHPDNKMEVDLCFTPTSVKMGMTFSMKPELNGDMEFTMGEEKTLPAPFNCTTKITKCSDTCIEDVSKYEDGAVYTNVSTFSNLGYTSKITGNSGYVGSCFFERVEPSLVGFYIMESHENMDKVMMEDAGLSASVAADMLKSIALKVTECNGHYTMTDYIGGQSKSVTFKLGVESEYNDPTFKMSGTTLCTRTGPGCYTNVFKDDKTGKTSIWEGTLTDDMFVYKVAKPLNTQTGSITYRRLADITGDWKVVSMSNIAAGMKEYGMPADLIKAAEAERFTSSCTYMGCGKIEWKHGSKVMPIPATTWKSGEEFSYEVAGFKVSEVIVWTKDGMTAASTSNGITTSFTGKCGKNFFVMESMIEGKPHTKSVSIMTRV